MCTFSMPFMILYTLVTVHCRWLHSTSKSYLYWVPSETLNGEAEIAHTIEDADKKMNLFSSGIFSVLLSIIFLAFLNT